MDQFDKLLEHGGERPLVLGIALHAQVSGAAFRRRHLRRALQHIAARRKGVWVTGTGQIAVAWRDGGAPEL